MDALALDVETPADGTEVIPIPPSEHGVKARELIDAFLSEGEITADERLIAAIPLAILDLADAFRQGM